MGGVFRLSPGDTCRGPPLRGGFCPLARGRGRSRGVRFIRSTTAWFVVEVSCFASVPRNPHLKCSPANSRCEWLRSRIIATTTAAGFPTQATASPCAPTTARAFGRTGGLCNESMILIMQPWAGDSFLIVSVRLLGGNNHHVSQYGTTDRWVFSREEATTAPRRDHHHPPVWSAPGIWGPREESRMRVRGRGRGRGPRLRARFFSGRL